MYEYKTPEVKVGDELAFLGGYGRGQWSIHEVERITPSGRIVCGPYTMNPDLNVRGTSSDFGRPYRGQPVTDDIREKVSRQNALAVLRRFDMENLSTSTLLKIMEAIKQDG